MDKEITIIKSDDPKDREVDQLAHGVFSSIHRNFTLISQTKIKTWKALSILAFTSGIAIGSVLIVKNNIEDQTRAATVSHLIEQMKRRGCVADGLLTGSGGDTSGLLAMIERSKCEYLHRAVETWAAPPDFALVENNMKKTKKGGLIYGMFLAEAVGMDAEYYYPDGERNFNFPAMCREGSQGFWGEGTCKAYFGSQEYRNYLKYITRKAIDLGVQSFMFGQIYFQDNSNLSKSWAKDIVKEMRQYAESNGKEIVIGAQTNDIADQKYLQLFDYIEGGVGINDKGEIENGPCFSRWWKKEGDRCWALLWNEKFSAKAKNVFLHLDWSGLDYDDMSRFARMDQKVRIKTLKNLYARFSSQGMGFLMPYLAVVYDKNGGCYGPAANYYSPGNKYSCKDEDALTAIFQGNSIGNDARFGKQSVPGKMISGHDYEVSIEVKNIGTETWTAEKQYRLGSQNPQDNAYWRGRINLDTEEKIKPGETKKFTFMVEAPNRPGSYDFQWKMVEENKEWFGGLSENVKITVEPPVGFPIVQQSGAE